MAEIIYTIGGGIRNPVILDHHVVDVTGEQGERRFECDSRICEGTYMIYEKSQEVYGTEKAAAKALEEYRSQF